MKRDKEAITLTAHQIGKKLKKPQIGFVYMKAYELTFNSMLENRFEEKTVKEIKTSSHLICQLQP